MFITWSSASFLALPPLVLLVGWFGVERNKTRKDALGWLTWVIIWLIFLTFVAGAPWKEDVAYNQWLWPLANAIATSTVISLTVVLTVFMKMNKSKLPQRKHVFFLILASFIITSMLLAYPLFTQEKEEREYPDVEFYFTLSPAENGSKLTVFPVKIEVSYLEFRIRNATETEFVMSGPFENKPVTCQIPENLEENTWYDVVVDFENGSMYEFARLGENVYVRYVPFICGTGFWIASEIKFAGLSYFVYGLFFTSLITGVTLVRISRHKRAAS
jgi:hypothetical protein